MVFFIQICIDSQCVASDEAQKIDRKRAETGQKAGPLATAKTAAEPRQRDRTREIEGGLSISAKIKEMAPAVEATDRKSVV